MTIFEFIFSRPPVYLCIYTCIYIHVEFRLLFRSERARERMTPGDPFYCRPRTPSARDFALCLFSTLFFPLFLDFLSLSRFLCLSDAAVFFFAPSPFASYAGARLFSFIASVLICKPCYTALFQRSFYYTRPGPPDVPRLLHVYIRGITRDILFAIVRACVA